VTLGLTRWAGGQLAEQFINDAEHAEVLALIEGAR
jgi:hypothetical protein